MITGLAKLGPSLKGSIEPQKKTSGTMNQASDFDQILNTKSDKDVRANFAGKDPVAPVEKGIQKWNPDKAEAAAAKDSSDNEPRMAQKDSTGREEQGSVKAKKIGEKSEKKSENSSQSREQVMLQFMDSMESEFSIPPAKIAEAMTNLSESDQLSSPEESASKIISQLDLPTDQEQRAYALYMGMLAQLKQVADAPKATPTPAFIAGATVPSTMLLQKEKRTQLNSSLDQLNQKFFMKAQAPEIPAMPEMAMENSSLMTPKTIDPLSMGSREIPLGKDLTYSQMAPKAMPQAEPLLPLDDQMLAEMDQIDPQSPEGQKLVKALTALGVAAAALKDATPVVDGNNQQMAQMTPMNFSQTAKMAKEDQGFGDSSKEQKSSTGDQSMFSQNMSGPAGHTTRADANATVKPEFAGALVAADKGAMASPQENQANIQQIMKQAQYMIKKGGGESKVQMNPEGLGEIHMKVVVNEGKVNLEMTADNKETKKLIESSLNDLKTNLSQHKLSMDQVRVDVSSHSANDRQPSDSHQQMQKQLDMKQEQSQNQQRDQARDFWGQFQDGGFERRANFFESPGIRAYGGSRKVEPLSPGSTSSTLEKRYSGSGKGRGIDLVA